MIAARTLQSKEAIEELAASGEDMSDIEVKASNAEKALSDIGVAVRDDKGAFRELEDVLKDVAGKWDTLNNTQQQMISEQLAGNNRRNYFVSLMEDYDRVMELQQKATLSTGAMMEAVNRQGETLEMVTNRLSNSMGELYASLIDSEGLKGVIKLVDGIVTAFTKLNDFVGGGLLPTLGMLSGALIALKLDLSALTGQGIISGAITLFNQLSTALAGLAVKAGLAKIAMGGLIGLLGGLAIAGIGKLIQHFTQTTTSAEDAMESIDAMSGAVKEYKEVMEQVNNQKLALVDIEEAVEKMEKLNKDTEEYKSLQSDVSQGLESFGQAYPDLAPYLENENILMEEKIRLIQQEIEETKKLTALQDLKDQGGVAAVQKMADDALRIVKERQMYEVALKQAMNAGVGEDGLTSDGTVWSTTINGMTVYYETLTQELDRLNNSLVINESQFHKTMATYVQLMDVGAITEEEFNKLKDTLYEVAHTMGWSTDAVDALIESLDKTEDSADGAGDAADVAAKKIERLNQAMNKTINESGDMNDQYVQTLAYLEEASGLLEGLQDGLDFSDLDALSDSDIMADFTGSIDNAAQVTEHLKNKMQELQDAAYEASINMALNNDETWKQIAQQVADSLGVQEQDMGAFVDSIAGMRQVDVENAQSAADAQQQAEMDMIRNGAIGYAGFINSKAGNRKVDMGNVAEFLNSQEVQEADTVEDLKRMWAAYYDAKAKTIRAELGDLSGKIGALAGDYGDLGNVDPALMSQFNNLRKQMRDLEATNDAMTNYFNNVNTALDGASSGLSQSLTNASNAINSAIGSGKGSGSKGSGSKGKGSGSKGGSGSKSTAQEVEDMEDLTDRYYKFNDVLRNVEKQLNKVRAERDNISTKKDYEKSIAKEIDLVEDQIDGMKKLQKEYQKEQNEIKKTLQKQGFKFDKNGDISNYEKQLKKLTDQANKCSDPAKKKAMQEQVKAIADLIDRYNELNDKTIPDLGVEIENLKTDIADLTADLEEQTKAVEDLGEAYYTLNRKIEDVDHALDMNQAKQQHAEGEEQVKLLEQQIDLLKQKQSLNKQAQQNARNDADDLRNQLSTQGVKFNKEGDITNYEQLIKQLTNNANKLVGDDKEEALENIENLIDLIDQYTTLTQDTLPGLELDWQDYQNQIEDVKDTLAELHQQEVEAATDAQKQVADAYEHYLTERYNKVKETLKKEQEEYNKAYEDENFDRTMANEQRKLDEIAQQIAIYERDMSAAGQAKLAQLRAEYEAQRNAMNDIIRENEHEQTNEDFSDQEQALDDALAEALDPAKLVEVVNNAIGSGLITIGDQVIELDDLMTTWLNETGDGLYTIGDTLKSELLDNLEVAKEILTEMGLTNGSGIDLFTNAQGLLTHAKPTNAMTSSVTFSAPLLYVEGNVDEGSVAELTAELQRMEQRIYENIADSMK